MRQISSRRLFCMTWCQSCRWAVGLQCGATRSRGHRPAGAQRDQGLVLAPHLGFADDHSGRITAHTVLHPNETSIAAPGCPSRLGAACETHSTITARDSGLSDKAEARRPGPITASRTRSVCGGATRSCGSRIAVFSRSARRSHNNRGRKAEPHLRFGSKAQESPGAALARSA